MAEYVMKIADEDRLEKITARTNVVFGKIMAKLEILLQHYNCSPNSSHGAANSSTDITTPEPLNINLLMHDEFRSSANQIKVPSVREQKLVQEEINTTELANDAFSTSDESLPFMEAIEEQSIVDESIGVRNLTVEEVIPMSEILDNPLVHMPLLHQDVNYPPADLTYGTVANPPPLQELRYFTKKITSLSHNMAPNQLISALSWELRWMYSTLECLSCARLNDQMLLPPPKPPDLCFQQMHVVFQVKCSRIMHPPHPESLDSRHMFVKMPSKSDIATWDPLKIQNLNSWQFSILTPSTLMKVCGDAFILGIVVEVIAHRYILPTTVTVIYCLLGVANSLQTHVGLTPFVTMMKISFKIATMRLISSSFSTCKMVVIYPLNDVIEQEASSLSNLHIVSAIVKIEKQLAVVVKLSMEAKLRDVASWDGHAFWKKFSDTFESLKVHFLRRNKEYVGKFLPIVEVLVVKWTQKEGTLIHRNFQIRMLENCLKQAVEDVKNLLMQENSLICAEFASVQAMLLRLKEALEEQKVVKQAYILYDAKGVLEEFARIIELQQVTIPNTFVLGICRPCCFDEASNWVYTMIKNDIGTIVDLFMVVFPQKQVDYGDFDLMRLNCGCVYYVWRLKETNITSCSSTFVLSQFSLIHHCSWNAHLSSGLSKFNIQGGIGDSYGLCVLVEHIFLDNFCANFEDLNGENKCKSGYILDIIATHVECLLMSNKKLLWQHVGTSMHSMFVTTVYANVLTLSSHSNEGNNSVKIINLMNVKVVQNLHSANSGVYYLSHIARSLQCKQWDPGKFFIFSWQDKVGFWFILEDILDFLKSGVNHNLEDKVGFKEDGNVMILIENTMSSNEGNKFVITIRTHGKD